MIGRIADKWTMLILEVLTELGLSLGAAFCGIWLWAEEHLDRVEAARRAFDDRPRG